jgi:hypothetical protein
MGIIYQHIRLANFARPEIEEVDAKALVDPARLRLIPNPDNPAIPGALAMGVCPVRKSDNA